MVYAAVDPLMKHLQSLMRHIDDVRENCQILGVKLIERNEFDFGKTLIQHGLVHDNSKFVGVEWDALGDSSGPLFEAALREHVTKNLHHPEAWEDGIHEMPRLYVAEMCCDWAARAAEFGTALWPWIRETAMPRFHFSSTDEVYKEVEEFLALLLEPPFGRGTTSLTLP